MNDENRLRRRRLMQALAGFGAVALAGPQFAAAVSQAIRKPIPSSGERLPVIGMGSWLTFDVGDNIRARAVRTQVLQAFFDNGGALIDSSPMYGSSQEVIGHALEQVRNRSALFAATKVWILGKGFGIRQMEDARRLWGVPRFDLMQVHNLLDWETHLETLKSWKAEGRVRYIGVTTSHGRRHDEMTQVMQSEPLDFVQFTYNILDREAEQRLLPLAAERGIAVIVNRPFQRGSLFGRLRGKPLPPWAAEFDCANWAQYLLKFVVSHPAVTCAIPATSRVDHMVENMGAGSGRLPDAAMRRRMVAHFESL
ncbi:MAG: aldo/keto reductase [Thiobacillaceae bacterium]|jgi:diketogulonate reductase-like aldo/keto reductase|nr:aldo/keto reductase [Thiobacillaceae bacterium]